jgi:hypothetical protein
MSPAERQRRRRQRLIEAARQGTLVRIYAGRVADRLVMAEAQAQELEAALREGNCDAYGGPVMQIAFSMKVLRQNLTYLQGALPPSAPS